MSFKLNPSILLFFTITICLAGCGGPSLDENNATVEALTRSISETSTAAASVNTSSDDSLQTAEAKATSDSRAAESTQNALGALSADAQSATAAAAAPILAQLSSYGVDPNTGHLAWIHPPFTLELDGYLDTDFANQYMATVVEDFVLSTDITWNTRYGSNGCGFILRSDGDEENPNHYMLVITRFGEGRAIFMTVVNGELVDGVDMYAPFHDPDFSWLNDQTNRLTVVGRGKTFSVFTNGHLQREIVTGETPSPLPIPPAPPTPEDAQDEAAMTLYEQQLKEHEEEVDQIQANYQARLALYRNSDTIFERGFVAMVVLSEAGKTTCHFDNTWLWQIEGSGS